MGGKNALIVLDDADVELAATAAVQGAFYSSGQRCTATSRVVVMKGVAEHFIAQVVERTRALKVGDGLEAGVQVGPLVDEKQLATVLQYLDIGKKEARLLCGGERLGGALANGNFVAPTVFAEVKSDHRIAKEEIFGPVLSVIAVADEAEAFTVANDSRRRSTRAMSAASSATSTRSRPASSTSTPPRSAAKPRFPSVASKRPASAAASKAPPPSIFSPSGRVSTSTTPAAGGRRTSTRREKIASAARIPLRHCRNDKARALGVTI
jgi:hypothetical protein